jgi:hypothetical protein
MRSQFCFASSSSEFDGGTAGLSGWKRSLMLFLGIDPI